MKRLWLSLLAVILIALTLLTLLITTQTGLKLTIKLLNRNNDLSIQTKNLHGRILGKVTADKLTVITPSNQWSTKNFILRFNPLPLLWNKIAISNIEMDTLSKKNRAATKAESSRQIHIPTISIRSAKIHSLKLELNDPVKKVEVQNINWSGKISAEHIDFDLTVGAAHGLFQSIAASIKGPLNHYQINASIISDHMTVKASGSGKGKSINLLLFSQSENSSDLSGTASVDWNDRLSWSTTLQLKKIKTKAIYTGGPFIHSLNAIISRKKQNNLMQTDWEVDLKTDSGNLRSQGFHNSATENFSWDINKINLHSFYPDSTGTLTSSGSWNQGVTQGSLHLTNGNFQKWKANDIISSWNGNYRQRKVGGINIRTQLLSYQGKTIKAGLLTIGKTVDHQTPFQLNTTFLPGFYDTQSIQTSGAFSIAAQNKKLSVTKLNLVSLGETWRLENKLSLQQHEESIQLTPFCLTHNSNFLCSSFSYNNGSWETHIKGKQIPLHHAIHNFHLTTPTNIDISLSQKKGEELLGKLQASAPNATLYLIEHSIETPVDLKKTNLSIDLLPHFVKFTSSSIWERHKLWNINGNVSRPDLAHPSWDSSQIQAAVELDAKDLDFINAFTQSTEIHSGIIQGKTTIQGSLGSPLVNGEVSVKQLEVQIVPIKNRIKNMRGTINFTGHKADFTLSGMTTSAPITLTGSSHFAKIKQPDTHFMLNAKKATLTNTKEFLTIGDLDLSGNIFENKMSMLGNIFVSDATIKPSHFSSATTLSDDVSIIGEQQISQWSPTMDVLVSLGDNIMISSNRLSGKLSGKTRIIKNPGSHWLSKGQIFITGGKVNDLDLNLKISDDSNIAYDNDPLNSPFINIKLYRVIQTHGFGLNSLASHNDLTVGISMVGPYHNLEVKPYSQPMQLSQSDILSYLLLGHPSNNTSAFNLASLLATAGSLSSENLSTGLVKLMSIKKTLGFTELGVQSNLTLDALGTPYGTDESGFVIGRYITPRIYVRYISGISTLLNLLQIQYFMGHKWSLQLQSGSISSSDVDGVDVLYHFTSLN